jgi:hypothetical protein
LNLHACYGMLKQEAEAKRARMASAMSAAEARANRLAQELNDVRSQLVSAPWWHLLVGQQAFLVR